MEQRNAGEIAEFLNSTLFPVVILNLRFSTVFSNAVKDASTELDPASLRAVFLIGDMGNLGISTEKIKMGTPLIRW